MWKDYFSFNKRQRNGILVLLGLIVVMLIWLNISNHLLPAIGNVDKVLVRPEINTEKKDTTEPAKNMDSQGLHKVSINKASIKELCKQPNINYYLAQAIVNYREQHGRYKTVNDLRNSAAVDSITFIKIAPYLTAN